MLYWILKYVMRITLNIFFKNISVKGQSHLQLKGPLIVVANHPGTFLDPIVIASLLNRKVYFLAKGELFKGPVLSWLLRQLNMIPVYRKQDDPSLMNRNDDTFKKCYEHLESGGAILIFPEGTSITERKLRPIKTGAARIALGAEARNEFMLGTKILCIGLNYQNPHQFNRDVLVNVEPAIEVGTYKDFYVLDSFKAAQKLTDQIKESLESQIVAVSNQQADQLVMQIEQLYKNKRLLELGYSPKDKEASFELTKKIVEVVHFFQEKEPERFEFMSQKISDYFRRLDMIGVPDDLLRTDKKKKSFAVRAMRALGWMVLGFPLYVYGLVHHWIPFELPAWISRKISPSKEYQGPIGMIGGMITFTGFYFLYGKLAWMWTQHAGVVSIYLLSLPLAGFFTYWYYHTLVSLRAKWMLTTLFLRKQRLVTTLIAQRNELLGELIQIREEFYARMQETSDVKR
ncbi:MAG: lysophospholipid acyltransferase family protein [Cytophagaceae bacterium]|nr:lysophospholipid acyltransferase family protein [Cytophagaceae bacterium]